MYIQRKERAQGKSNRLILLTNGNKREKWREITRYFFLYFFQSCPQHTFALFRKYIFQRQVPAVVLKTMHFHSPTKAEMIYCTFELNRCKRKRAAHVQQEIRPLFCHCRLSMEIERMSTSTENTKIRPQDLSGQPFCSRTSESSPLSH